MAFRYGISPSEFWRLTPYQTIVLNKAALEERKLQQRAEASKIWHTAALIRCKELPALDEFIPPEEMDSMIAERLKFREFMTSHGVKQRG